MSEPPAQQQLCASCRSRPAAFVLDRLGQIGQLFSGPPVAFPVWACENCVQNLLGQVLDVVSVASVCKAQSYQQLRAAL
jgi:hypothetical protein